VDEGTLKGSLNTGLTYCSQLVYFLFMMINGLQNKRLLKNWEAPIVYEHGYHHSGLNEISLLPADVPKGVILLLFINSKEDILAVQILALVR